MGRDEIGWYAICLGKRWLRWDVTGKVMNNIEKVNRERLFAVSQHRRVSERALN